jgi:hypothetical protein
MQSSSSMPSVGIFHSLGPDVTRVNRMLLSLSAQCAHCEVHVSVYVCTMACMCLFVAYISMSVFEQVCMGILYGVYTHTCMHACISPKTKINVLSHELTCTPAHMCRIIPQNIGTHTHTHTHTHTDTIATHTGRTVSEEISRSLLGLCQQQRAYFSVFGI